MKQSQLHLKTLKAAPKHIEAISHQLLIRAGFIRKLAAGIYNFLPLGWQVHEKIRQIIREEMNKIDGQEIFLATVQPKELWQKTDRWDHMEPPLFKLKDIHKKDYCLGSTHEEVITQLASEFIQSYKDLPLKWYQIQNKFRNELRSFGGLLRVREFIMKDLYSFHSSEDDLNKYYEKVLRAYHRIYQRCGLPVYLTEASSGTIGGGQSHEFIVLSKTGEDKILICQNCNWAINKELAKIEKCQLCNGKLNEERGIEVGHTFKLGTEYSKKMGLKFMDENGREKDVVMGCYGIGLGRLMATIVEVHHDKQGIIWPKQVTPYNVHLISIGERFIAARAEKIYEQLIKKGIEVLYDDREEVSPGEKFAEADLIGLPIRIIVSEKTLVKNSVEVKKRSEERIKLVKIKTLLESFEFKSCLIKSSVLCQKILALI